MVLPAPAADPVAVETGAWLGKLARALDRSSGAMLVLLREANPVWLGPVVRALSPAPPWAVDDREVLRVCLTAPELAQVEPGSRVLLRVRAQDTTWLNLYRPLIADRELRLVLWADGEASDALQREAVDFVDWIVRVIAVPAAKLPAFVVEGMRAGLDAGDEIVWRGPLLDDTLRAAGLEMGVVEFDAAMSHATMLEALARPGLPVVTGVGRERDVWRVRMALAHAGRSPGWIAREPAVEIAGARVLDARLADWDEATKRLDGAGRSHPALLAAWLDLEPARIEAAVAGTGAGTRGQEAEIDGTPLLTELRELGEATPDPTLVGGLADSGFVDVATELALVRWDRKEDDDAGELVDWLIEHGRTKQALEVATQWIERAERGGERHSLAAAWIACGDINVALGNGDDARHYFEDALHTLRDLVGRDGSSRELFGALQRLGDINLVLGNSADARHYLHAALSTAKQLVDRKPDRIDLQRDLCVSYAKVGDLALALGNDARQYFHAALSIAKHLVDREPDRTDIQPEVSNAYVKLGDINLALGNLDDARHYFHAAVSIAKQLVDREPDRIDLQRDLCVAYVKLGDTDLALVDDALDYVDTALRIAKRLIDREPDRIDLQRAFSSAHAKLGDLLLLLGDAEIARRYIGDALAIAQALVEREPDRADLQRDLAILHDKLLHNAPTT